MISGVIIVNKEAGMTSFGAVARIRRLFHEKKAGHTGTLDPDAEGVLPVCLGKATRIVSQLTGSTKTYRAKMRLGVTTDTQDESGTVLEERPVRTTPGEIREGLESFLG